MNFTHLESKIQNLFDTGIVTNVAIKIGRGDEVLFEKYRSKTGDLNEYTKFDMASVTKILCTTTLALLAMDEGLLDVNDSVGKFFDLPADKKDLKILHLLTHTMGFGHKHLDYDHVNYDNVAEFILSIPCDVEIGSQVLYSCPGFILLGKILEKIYGERLDALFEKRVCLPLGMNNTSFGSKDPNTVNANVDESMRGVVNDYNCRHLGKVAGNAGSFSCINDLTKFAKMLLLRGEPLFSKEIFWLAAKNYTKGMSQPRALGFVYGNDEYEQLASLFESAVGHCGHTGQSLFAEPSSGLYVIVLTDATKNVGIRYNKDYEVVKKMRHDLHLAIKNDL